MVLHTSVPGGQVTFNFNAVAPVVPGLHHFQWQMLHQGSALFGDLTPDVLVNVAPFTFTGDTTALSLSIMDGAPDGGPAETLFTLTPLGGFTGNVALTLSYLDTSGNLVNGAPGGMDYWFDPAPDDTPMTGQVAIPDANPQDCLLSICPCAGNPVAGTYTLVITATSGTTTLTQNVTLTITP